MIRRILKPSIAKSFAEWQRNATQEELQEFADIWNAAAVVTQIATKNSEEKDYEQET